MDKHKKQPNYTTVTRLPTASGMAPVALMLFLLFPGSLFYGETRQWPESLDATDDGQFHKVLKIYSVVRLHRSDIEEGSAWAIAKAVVEESIKYSLDPILVLAVISVESRFEAAAISPKGARGLMQILPTVGPYLAEEADLKIWEGEKSLDDPIVNIKLGVFYLSRLIRRFRDPTVALTAYNWGPTQIQEMLDDNEELPLGYARKVLSTYRLYKSRGSNRQRLA